MKHLKQHYGDTEGPLGIPCTDRQAQALDRILQSIPRDDLHAPGKAIVTKAPTELLAGERADVSWISTEDADRQHDIILARGMNDEHFKLNPVVTMQHCYWMPPVGRSLWRRRVRDGARHGIKAKTLYPPRPDAWPAGNDWPPDAAFLLVQAGLLAGKSIGFLPTRVRQPTDEEIRADTRLQSVRRIVEEWVLLEYACVYLPAQQHAVVESVSKGLTIPEDFRKAMGLGNLPVPAKEVIPFTPWEEIEQSIQRRLEAIDFAGLAQKIVEAACARARGRI